MCIVEAIICKNERVYDCVQLVCVSQLYIMGHPRLYEGEIGVM